MVVIVTRRAGPAGISYLTLGSVGDQLGGSWCTRRTRLRYARATARPGGRPGRDRGRRLRSPGGPARVPGRCRGPAGDAGLARRRRPPRRRPLGRPPRCCCCATAARRSRYSSCGAGRAWPSPPGCTPSPAAESTRATATPACRGSVRRRRSGVRCWGARPSWPRRWSVPPSASCFEECGVLLAGSDDEAVVGRCQRTGVGAGPAGAARPQPGHVAAADPARAAVALGPAAPLGALDDAGVRAAALRHLVLRGCPAVGTAGPRRRRRGRPDPLDRPGRAARPASGRVGSRCTRRPRRPSRMSLLQCAIRARPGDGVEAAMAAPTARAPRDAVAGARPSGPGRDAGRPRRAWRRPARALRP